MACQFESRIFELDDLPTAERALVHEHLTHCGECRELARLLHEADACLEQAIRAPSLSPHFSTRLHARIARVSLSESELRQRKQQAEAEYQAELARLRRSSWNGLQVLDWIGWAALALVVGWLVSMGLGTFMKTYPVGGMEWTVGAGISAMLLFAVGLALTFWNWNRYLWGDE